MPMLEMIFIYVLGALGYGSIELLWRGRTHWTMLLTGGLCFLMIYLIQTRLRLPAAAKPPLCAAGITLSELLVGLLVNRVLGWGVWDYSALPCNLLGQICLRYSIYWLLLSLPLLAFSRWLRALLFSPKLNSLP